MCVLNVRTKCVLKLVAVINSTTPAELLISYFQEPMVASCQTGVIACILALAAFICGNHDVAIYDGSFNEWKANQ